MILKHNKKSQKTFKNKEFERFKFRVHTICKIKDGNFGMGGKQLPNLLVIFTTKHYIYVYNQEIVKNLKFEGMEQRGRSENFGEGQ